MRTFFLLSVLPAALAVTASDYRQLQEPITCTSDPIIQFTSRKGHVVDGIFKKQSKLAWNGSPVYADNFGTVIYHHTDGYYRVAAGQLNSANETCILKSATNSRPGAELTTLNGRAWRDCSGRPVDLFNAVCVPTDTTDLSNCTALSNVECGRSDMCVVIDEVGAGHANGFELAAILCAAQRAAASTFGRTKIIPISVGATGIVMHEEASSSRALFGTNGSFSGFTMDEKSPTSAYTGYSRYAHTGPRSIPTTSSSGVLDAVQLCALHSDAGAHQPAPEDHLAVLIIGEGVQMPPPEWKTKVGLYPAVDVAVINLAPMPASADSDDAVKALATAGTEVTSLSLSDTAPGSLTANSDAAFGRLFESICERIPTAIPQELGCPTMYIEEFSPSICEAGSEGDVCAPTKCAPQHTGTPKGSLTCRSGEWEGELSGCAPVQGGDTSKCATEYTQQGYVTDCKANTPDGTLCSASCAPTYSGTATGQVMCLKGQYVSSFSGCSRCDLPSSVCTPGTGLASEFTLSASYDKKECYVTAAGPVQLKCANGQPLQGANANAFCTGMMLVGGFTVDGAKLSCSAPASVPVPVPVPVPVSVPVAQPGPANCTTTGDCLPGEFCWVESGRCGDSGVCALAPTGCTRIYDPVCGCDGATYSNECEAHSSGMNVDNSQLMCKIRTITPTFNPLSGTDLTAAVAPYVLNGTDKSDSFSLPQCGKIVIVDGHAGDDKLVLGNGTYDGYCTLSVDLGDGRDTVVVDLSSEVGHVLVTSVSAGYLSIQVLIGGRVRTLITLTFTNVEVLEVYTGFGQHTLRAGNSILGKDGFVSFIPSPQNSRSPSLCTVSEWGPFYPPDNVCLCGQQRIRQRMLLAPPPEDAACQLYEVVDCGC